MVWFNRTAMALVMSLAACSQAETSSDPATTDSVQAARVTAQSLPSADWLAGEWCFERYTAGGEVSEENITYIFEPDGTLLYQTNSSTPVEMPGSYEIADGKLVVKPALALFPFEEATTTEDGMVLRWGTTGEFHWTRGACGQ